MSDRPRVLGGGRHLTRSGIRPNPTAASYTTIGKGLVAAERTVVLVATVPALADVGSSRDMGIAGIHRPRRHRSGDGIERQEQERHCERPGK